MKQRVCIAIAISMQPKVIIADEPTSALDVVVQRQIMQTLSNVQKRLGASILLVGHDMGLMAQVRRPRRRHVRRQTGRGRPGPRHLQGPHASVHPAAHLQPAVARRERSPARHPRPPPSLLNPPSGCVFHPRCPQVMPRCSVDVPALHEARPNRSVACHLYDETSGAMTASARSQKRVAKVFGSGLRQAPTSRSIDFSLTVERRRAVVHHHRRRKWQRQDDPGAAAAGLHPAHVRRDFLSRQESVEDGARRLDGRSATKSRRSFRIRSRCSIRSTRSITC